VSRRIETDLCIIGGGSGGLSVAAGAVQMGARVVLIEGGRMGGDCLNHGCVPSKSLIAAAQRAHAMTAGAAFGVTPVVPEVDFASAKDHVERVVAAIAPHDSAERFEALGVTVLREHARFVSDRVVEAGHATVKARRFVIATGSRPLVPPIPGLDAVRVHTNEDIFALRERPEHLLVLGAGPVGLELAQAHRRLGCRVTVLEAARALGREDPELAAVVLEQVRAEGVAVIEGAKVVRASGGADAVALETEEGDRHAGSHLLVAVGRRPGLDGLGLEAAGVAHDGRGVVVDAGLRTSNRRIYAIGDAAGGAQFTHLASYHAGLVVRSALFGLPVRASMAHVPRVTFTDPELAQVGLTEAEAREAHGSRLEVLRFDYADLDRARTAGVDAGRIKVMVTAGRPVGAGIAGAQAGELIGLWALALASRLKIGAVANMVAPYPTLGEISKRAAGQYYVPRLFESPVVKRLVRLVQRLP
jgi:pyruvate/2-oxoglutarate dehydrogenase complex dihydrolipoamide dehydrogenase (E3) component